MRRMSHIQVEEERARVASRAAAVVVQRLWRALQGRRRFGQVHTNKIHMKGGQWNDMDEERGGGRPPTCHCCLRMAYALDFGSRVLESQRQRRVFVASAEVVVEVLLLTLLNIASCRSHCS